MENTFLSAFIGGIIIGISALIYSGVLGRVMGVSGILKGIISQKKDDIFWRYTFFIGLIGGAVLYRIFYPETRVHLPRYDSLALAVLAGGLVGIGVTLANGCTSGHAICGIGRLSLRSFVSTCIFLGMAFSTNIILHYITLYVR